MNVCKIIFWVFEALLQLDFQNFFRILHTIIFKFKHRSMMNNIIL